MIRVGIAGIGFMGMTHYNAYQKIRGVKVAALCEKYNKERLAGDWTKIQGNFGPRGQMMDLSGIARYTELKEMLADPNLDVIDICMPPADHCPVTIAALKAGKHVFCEKPIALKVPDAKRMTDTAKQAGKLLMIGHVLPFYPEYNFAYKAITGGKYGKLLGGHFKRIISDPVWMTEFYNPNKTGGPMLDLHVHDAHFIRLVCGMPEAVHCVGAMRGEVVGRFTTQFIFAEPKMVSAASGVIDQQGRPFTHGYEIYLEKATLFFDYMAMPTASDVILPLTLLTSDGKVTRPQLGSGDPCEAFVAELSEVVRAVRTGKPSALLAGELARDAVILCHKQTESVLRGRAVKV